MSYVHIECSGDCEPFGFLVRSVDESDLTLVVGVKYIASSCVLLSALDIKVSELSARVGDCVFSLEI